MNIPREMSVVISGMQIQAVITFVNVNQRNDIWPSLRVDRADVRDPLCAEELPRLFVGHQALFSVHLAAKSTGVSSGESSTTSCCPASPPLSAPNRVRGSICFCLNGKRQTAAMVRLYFAPTRLSTLVLSHARTAEPQYEIQSGKTDHIAMHKGSALKLRRSHE
jgi:hypothetical protein